MISLIRALVSADVRSRCRASSPRPQPSDPIAHEEEGALEGLGDLGHPPQLGGDEAGNVYPLDSAPVLPAGRYDGAGGAVPGDPSRDLAESVDFLLPGDNAFFVDHGNPGRGANHGGHEATFLFGDDSPTALRARPPETPLGASGSSVPGGGLLGAAKGGLEQGVVYGWDGGADGRHRREDGHGAGGAGKGVVGDPRQGLLAGFPRGQGYDGPFEFTAGGGGGVGLGVEGRGPRSPRSGFRGTGVGEGHGEVWFDRAGVTGGVEEVGMDGGVPGGGGGYGRRSSNGAGLYGRGLAAGFGRRTDGLQREETAAAGRFGGGDPGFSSASRLM